MKTSTDLYEILSQVKISLFITIDFKYKLDSSYKNNELIFSSVITYVNGKVDSITTTEKDGEYYSVTKNNHSSKYLNEIKNFDAVLYFIESKEVVKIFSKFDGIEKPIKQNKYQITNPKNEHLSEYLYKNNILESLQFDDFYFN